MCISSPLTDLLLLVCCDVPTSQCSQTSKKSMIASEQAVQATPPNKLTCCSCVRFPICFMIIVLKKCILLIECLLRVALSNNSLKDVLNDVALVALGGSIKPMITHSTTGSLVINMHKLGVATSQKITPGARMFGDVTKHLIVCTSSWRTLL